jgi:hypothetical protein
MTFSDIYVELVGVRLSGAKIKAGTSKCCVQADEGGISYTWEPEQRSDATRDPKK